MQKKSYVSAKILSDGGERSKILTNNQTTGGIFGIFQRVSGT